MDAAHTDDDERRFVVDAIVSYADACTLPTLTPTCPFYERSAQGPTCGEQCRVIATMHGAPTRRVTEVRIDGLVMTGRELPVRAVSGASLYDAGQIYVQERGLEPRSQSTASLLLGLRAAMRPSVLGNMSSSSRERTLLLWSELERRGVDVEAVVRGALLKDLAMPIILRASAPEMIRAGVTPPDVSEAFKQEMMALDGRDWCAVLDATVESYGRPDDAMADAVRNPYAGLLSVSLNDVDMQGMLGNAPDQALVARVASNAKLLIAFSRVFAGRVEEWLSRLMEDSLDDLLAGTSPPPSVFLALPASRGVRDEGGLWTWERLTQTHVEQWSTSTLLLEWRHLRGEEIPGCPLRVAAERTLDAELITELALDRLANRRPQASPKRGLAASSFTEAAAKHLRRGEWREAANVFSGLVDLRPADGEALNNLGFCMMPFDRTGALEQLEKATLYSRSDPAVNVANRMLALHLEGRDDEALEVAEGTPVASGSIRTAFLWNHADRSSPLTLDDRLLPADYIRQLTEHIRQGVCA